MPLANRLLHEDQLAEPEPRYPLDLGFCPACSLVQIGETVPPETLFREYLYFSSFSDTMLASCRALAARLAHQHCLRPGARVRRPGLTGAAQVRDRLLNGDVLVVEIASNDGYLLQFYRDLGVPVLGIDPALNVAKVAEERGIPTIAEFFGHDLAARLVREGRRADVIHANNVLAHVADLNDFVRGMKLLLKPAGTVVIEVPYVRDLVEGAAFDTIYHEHLCYFSLTALERLFRRHGLTIQDVECIPIHGGSLRLFVGRGAWASETVWDMIQDEAERDMEEIGYYRALAARAEAVREQLRDLLHGLRRRGARIAGYGAAAKGATLLNYCSLGTETIEYVVDRSEHKQGRYMPGVHIPITSVDRLREDPPDYLLILPWNLAAEIVHQQAEYGARGGRFILPVPEVRIVEPAP